MGQVKRLLESEWTQEMQELGKMQLGSEEYRATVDGVVKLADRIIELEKVEFERVREERNREFEENFKAQQIKDEKRDRIIKNCLTGISVVGGLVGAFTVSVMSMNFEREGTFTTEAGRSSLRHLLKFKF